MTEIGLALAGLGLLYLTRRKMTRELGRLVRKFGGGERTFLVLWSAIFLPGTIIHEVSHFLAAALTGARTGRVEIFPELPRKTLDVKGSDFSPVDPRSNPSTTHRLGFVETQRLGPVRGFVVGVAPLLVGVGLLIWLSANFKTDALGMTERLIPLLKIYVFFTVANSLFLSWADFKQALPLLVIAAIFAAAAYFLGIKPQIVPDSRLAAILASLWKTLLISAGVNLVAIIILATGNKLIKRQKN